MRLSRRGQGTLEYILVMVVILLAIMAASPKIRTVVENDLFDSAKGQITRASTYWTSRQ